MSGLIDDLNDEGAKSGRDYGCSACDALARLEDAEKTALANALASTMSERALMRVSAKHDLHLGRAGIRKHRQEGHTS